MKAKEYLKQFMKKHGLSRGEIWERHELLKLMDEYRYHSDIEENQANEPKKETSTALLADVRHL